MPLPVLTVLQLHPFCSRVGSFWAGWPQDTIYNEVSIVRSGRPTNPRRLRDSSDAIGNDVHFHHNLSSEEFCFHHTSAIALSKCKLFSSSNIPFSRLCGPPSKGPTMFNKGLLFRSQRVASPSQNPRLTHPLLKVFHDSTSKSPNRKSGVEIQFALKDGTASESSSTLRPQDHIKACIPAATAAAEPEEPPAESTSVDISLTQTRVSSSHFIRHSTTNRVGERCSRLERHLPRSYLCPCCAPLDQLMLSNRASALSSRRSLLIATGMLGGLVPVAAQAEAAMGELTPSFGGVYEEELVTAAEAALARWRHGHAAWQEQLFAQSMAGGMQLYEAAIVDVKKNLLKDLGSDRQVSQSGFSDEPLPFLEVVEVGVGTGPNFGYYSRPDLHVTGVDPNGAMEPFARAAAERANLPFTFLPGVAERLPLANNSADVVVCTLLLCSVADVPQVLQEVQRVLKPGGRFLFLEHVAAPEGTNLRRLQAALDPLQQFLADGCHLTRDPLPAMQSVGFSSLQTHRLSVEGMSLLSPHLCGVAVK
eukprot:TRINITY_DN13595_c0_g2_i1.p1 TRINITY_DN13595_c0_g2~~TRINITY_DN13595_c0_g2_i1.p1  ORF type:complete len:534 (+),score=31.06 TRINITY_DN13595_c0_g2_i1:316-1917(+)